MSPRITDHFHLDQSELIKARINFGVKTVVFKAFDSVNMCRALNMSLM